VWTNILNNACDAVELSRGDELGTIEIVTSFTEGRVVVTIANSGPRIPEDILGKIFDPFFTTKPIGKGTGLGLSICAGIVRRAGGTISARNEPDRVIFEVSLPAAGKQGPPSTDALPCPARDDAWAAGNWGPQTSAQTTD
jgi:signal transduction histidine kinase